MRKLCLIIPLQKSQSIFLRRYILLFVLSITPFFSYSDRYGCYVDEYSYYLFHNEYSAMGGHPNYLFSSDNNNHPDTYYIKGDRCPLNMNTTCYLYNYNGTFKTFGYVTDFDATNCPLDDYIPLFLIFTAGVALFQIRKRNMSFANENINHHGRF